jgi:hypothetical protein
MHRSTKNDLENLSRWMNDILALDPILEELEPLTGDEFFPGDSYGTVTSLIGSSPRILAYKVEAPKALVPLMRALHAAGWKRRWSESSKLRLQVRYVRDAVDFELDVHFVETETQRCRLVPVGEEMRPVYKELCGEELRKWEEEHDEAPMDR